MSLLWKTSFAVVAVAAAVAAGFLLADRPAAAPIQPIEFSHRVHAGDSQISCLYCHTGADRSTIAGVPAVATCYECHRGVKLRTPEITKLLNYWETKQPIRWVRVYTLPEHVYFSHKRHTRAGVDCQQCHGDVEGASRLAQVSDLTMGWCVSCHQERAAPLECSTCHK